MTGGSARGRGAVALLAAAVDAAAGLAAAAGTILWQGGSRAQIPTFVLACTAAALASQAVLVPGWVLAVGRPARPVLIARLSAACASFWRACAAGGASAIVLVFTGSTLLTAIVMPLVLAGTAALGVAAARRADPGLPAPASGDGPARAIAAASAVTAWLAVGLVWAFGGIDPPVWANDARIWWGALAVGPAVVALAGLPPHLHAAADLACAPPSTVLGRAAASVGALGLLAAALLLTEWALRRARDG